MRQLYITRGIPGSGKTTFLKENGLQDYTISPDTIRILMSSPVINTDGRLTMPSKDDTQVWELLRELLEKRMAHGELTIVDATHTTPNYFNDYANLAKKYRYKLFVIDFANVPLAICKERNRNRVNYKVVDEKVLEKMYERLQKFSIPKFYKVLKPEEVHSTLENDLVDLSQYSRIHHIGDIQGCFTPLKQYFDKYPFSNDEYYIFVGDLLDRGTENAEALQYVCDQFVDKPNVTFLEGNHDLHIWKWISNQPVTSVEFNSRTRVQLEAGNIDKVAVSRMIRSMRECLLYSYNNKKVLVTHAGVSSLPDKLKLISSDQYIRGSGSYSEVGIVDDAFVSNTDDNTYQIHGHRNQQNYATQYNERTYNLEGKVEFGGDLRVVQLTIDGFECKNISNSSSGYTLYPEKAPLVHSMRNNHNIIEKVLPGNISSFNFKAGVFHSKKWTKQTIAARGLFINNLTNEVVIRAYDKFFNINERRDTEMIALQKSMVFPAKGWIKENGYLGLVGYDSASANLIFSSKSTTEGEFAGWFKQLFIKEFGKHENEIKEYLKNNNVCLVFEVILPSVDPHIISYEEDHLVLLDIVKRQFNFEKLSDSQREEFAFSIGARTKQLAAEFADWNEFKMWYEGIKGLEFKVDNAYVEGFVIEDSNNFQFKIKLDFYNLWKQLRDVLDSMKSGKRLKTKKEFEYPEFAQSVIDFMQSLPEENLSNHTIIDIRKKFFRNTKGILQFVFSST